MTRNRFNQAKHKSTSTSTNNLTLSKARGLFLEEIDNIDDVSGRGLNSKPNQQSCHHYVDPNSLVERPELLILETKKAGHDGLYDEMLDISEQLLSKNIINQEQLDSFVFN